MAGHSKWANTKHRREEQNTRKNKMFAKIIRELVTASNIGGKDIKSNARLRSAIDKALANNMTKETLNRAIIRGTDHIDKSKIESIIIYEGYGPGRVAIMIKCLKTNQISTLSTIRHTFIKNGGNLSNYGTVSHLFKKKIIISFTLNTKQSATMIDIAIDSGADDIIMRQDGKIDVHVSSKNFKKIEHSLKLAEFKPETLRTIIVPSNYINTDIETTSKLLQLIDKLKSINEVKEIYHNSKLYDPVNTNI